MACLTSLLGLLGYRGLATFITPLLTPLQDCLYLHLHLCRGGLSKGGCIFSHDLRYQELFSAFTQKLCTLKAGQTHRDELRPITWGQNHWYMKQKTAHSCSLKRWQNWVHRCRWNHWIFHFHSLPTNLEALRASHQGLTTRLGKRKAPEVTGMGQKREKGWVKAHREDKKKL